MSLILLAPEIISKETVISTFAKIALQTHSKFYLSENDTNEIYIAKHYDGVENSMYLALSDESTIKQRSKIANISIDNTVCFIISGSDQAHYDHFIFDFLNAYFIIHPNR